MPLILLACASGEPVETVEVVATWSTGAEAASLRAQGAVVSGSGLDETLENLAQAEHGWLSTLPGCAERIDVVEQMAAAVGTWPSVDQAPQGGVDTVAVRLRDAGELQSQLDAAQVADAVAQARVDCAAGLEPGPELSAGAVDMQVRALRSLAEVLRFLPQSELEPVVDGGEVRGWLGLSSSGTG